MKIYTKTGDQGTTSLFKGKRVPKHHIRVRTYGTFDELNCWIGLLADQKIAPKIQTQLRLIQHHLFELGAILAAAKETETNEKFENKQLKFLEEAIDEMNKELPPLKNFILPGGHQTVSFCHLARAVCRRAERFLTELLSAKASGTPILPYINRLSDYLFVLARKLTCELNADEVLWIPEK